MGRSSGERKSSTDSFIKNFLYVLLFVLLLNTFANLFLSKPTVFDLLRLRVLEKELDKKIKEEINKNRRLQNLYEFMKNNPREFKEMFIREYLLKIKRGERIHPLPENLR
ncbi:hypothetical protein [Aquifex sp.]